MKGRGFGPKRFVGMSITAVALICCWSAPAAAGAPAAFPDSAGMGERITAQSGGSRFVRVPSGDRPQHRRLVAQANPAATGGGAQPRSTPAAVPSPFPKSDAVLPTGKHENVWGPFEGRVVDAETQRGIAGAAVILLWLKDIPNPVEPHEEFDDVRWAVTDTEGRFSIPRRDPGLLRRFHVSRGAFLSCVAPGYFPYEFTPKYDARIPNARLQTGSLIIRLRNSGLTPREALRRLGEFETRNLSWLHDQETALNREINERRAMMGLQPVLLSSGQIK